MAAYTSLDQVEAAPKFGRSGPPGWGFHAWSNLLDDEAPHRGLLKSIAAAHPEVIVTLPKADRYEDYVEGSLKSGSKDVWVYFETICSHLWLWAPDRKAAEWARQLVASANASS